MSEPSKLKFLQKINEKIKENQKIIIRGLIATAALAGIIYGIKKLFSSNQANEESAVEEPNLKKQPNGDNIQDPQLPIKQNNDIQKPEISPNNKIIEKPQPLVDQPPKNIIKPDFKKIVPEETNIQETKSNIYGIEVKYFNNGQTLELTTISAILEKSIDIAEVDYTQITLNNRKQRREIMNSNSDQYEKLIIQYNEDVEAILQKAQEKILSDLNIKKENFEESVLTLMEKGLYQQMYMLQAAIRQKIKEKLPAQKNISIELTKQVIIFQVKILNEKPELFQKVMQNLQKQGDESTQLIPLVLNIMFQDLIFEKFEIEEEDQMKNMMGLQLNKDEELHDLLVEIEEAMFKLMGSMGMGMDMEGYDMMMGDQNLQQY